MHLRGIAIRQILTRGADQWMVFPVVRKNVAPAASRTAATSAWPTGSSSDPHAIIPDNGNEAARAQPSWSGAMRAIEPRMPLVAVPSTGNGVVPVSPQATLVGGLLPSYGIDLLQPHPRHPGDAAAGQRDRHPAVRDPRLNAWMRAQRLEELEQAGTEGLTLTGQGAPPLTFAALQERTYTLTVTEDGPPAIDATYTWTFDNGEVVRPHITGSRIVAWCWPPDWTDRVRAFAC